jgi:hypothetical protein
MRLLERMARGEFQPRSTCNFVGTALAIGLGVAAASSVASAAIGAHAAGKASNAQVDAAKSAAELTHEDSQASLAFQKQQYADQQKNTQPWITAGQGAISQLSSDLKDGTYHDWTGSFTAPTAATEQNDPGYQFRLNEGMKALERSASAKGGLITGGTAKAEQQYGQDYASNEYQNVYNRDFQQYQEKFNEFNTNQTNRFNRYAAIAGAGQTANTAQGQVGQAVSNNVANIYGNDSAQAGAALQNAGAARASGYINGANAWMSGINGLSSLALLAGKRIKKGSFI